MITGLYIDESMKNKLYMPKNNSGRKPLKEKDTKNTKNKPLTTNINIAIY